MSKRSSILLALPLVMAFVAGCGSTSSPVAPVDTVAPVPVAQLEATTVTTGSVELVWTANTEADLAGYRVYRGIGNGDVSLVSVETAATYRDGTVTTGNAYRYQVAAFDTAGNESSRVVLWVTIGAGGSGGVWHE
jgi:fibronectin type 3 domain-containing protein